MTNPSLEYAALTSDDLVTGEAVALDLPAASFGSRIASGLIDIIVTVISAFVVITILGSISAGSSEALVYASMVAALIVIFLVIPTTVETVTRGRSLGKLALGLRTVRDDAGPISFQHAFIRALVGFVEIYPLTGVPAFFSALLSDRGKRLGDHAAGTYVIRDRFALQLPPPVPMPYALQDWARNADITALPTPLALATRQYLSRLGEITPQARTSLGLSLAEQMRPYVAPAPPAGTPPEVFLTAVLVARRDRDLVRLQREAALRHRLFSRR
ncbi:RDD family protein [Nocardioides marmoriginsengisoli]|uniref:RDD family protein n=1 Tax=Nocardioides marmoriginsengisoli TaxID=661483 RepID=A0A3N0CCJ4_9ACTN|nr:RDD family protein [Nocardioides marmoriginsengisoli]RNL61148.1 RDD family protein [Nocardioides marmoriginsengisoli]